MDSIIVTGGKPLIGQIKISGAKNACLPIMTCALLTEDVLTLSNVPNISDIATMGMLLKHHGVQVHHDNETVHLQAEHITDFTAPYDMVRKMRASFWVLGPLLARFGQAKVSMPGGCAIGARQVDLHLAGLEAMGAKITIDNGYVVAEAKGKLNGVHFNFDKVSVGATINLIMAACLADGETKLMNCASEPEIIDMCRCLVKMGAKIDGIGTSNVTIQGQKSLHGTEHQIIPDRIETGTYMVGAAITRGKVILTNTNYDIVENIALKLIESGVNISSTSDTITISHSGAINAVNIDTRPYPGFSTDLQAQFMALMTIADGASVVTENIFENRFMHVPELCRMGADISIIGHSATIRGVKKLRGAEVMASDLRASISLVLAGLAAEGSTKIRRIYHIDRGYNDVVRKLVGCGADIVRTHGDTV